MYDGIIQGLKEALAYQKGSLRGVKVDRVRTTPIKVFTPAEIKQIRLDSEMTQELFAFCIGVSKKSVEAWEGGRSKPDGAARRLLGLMQNNPNFARDMGIYVRETRSPYLPVVIKAVAGPDYTVYAYFSDGKIKRYDMKPLIEEGGVFTVLKDKAFFSERLTVLNDTVAWDVSGDFDPTKCIDIDPFTVYAGQDVSDPLEYPELCAEKPDTGF